MSQKPKKARWQSCNVLQVGADSRQLWAFNAGKKGFTLAQEQALPPDGPLPPKLVAKDWKRLFQPRLNIAWLPVDKVFLRVTQLPTGDFAETLSMVELQLEKLSPLPVTQIVWTIQILPHGADNLQTIIVIIVARDLVQEFLGRLEGQGYLADRLELPILDQLQATPITEDGAWIYPTTATGKFTALVAWWYGGVLRSLGLLHIPAGANGSAVLKEQLTQMSWAGELEGWLTSPPRWHLVADESTAADWQPMIHAWLGQDMEVESPISRSDLATMTADRVSRTDFRTGLLPVEYSTRYQQQFVDRLWMRGLGTVLSLYVVGVMIYFAALSWQGMKADNVERNANSMSVTYTNTLKLQKQYQILKERQDLKFAALDCWKATAEALPESLSVVSFDFGRTEKLTLNGTAPADQGSLVSKFNDRLRKSIIDGRPLFLNMEPPSERIGPNNTVAWNFSGDLARGEGGQ